MKVLLEKVLPYVPQYLGDLGALLAGPKRFISRKDVAADDTFVESLVFVAISLVLVVLLSTPLYPEKDRWMRMTSYGVDYLLSGALFSAALHAAWRAVGGRVPLRSFFVAYAYLYGGITVLSTALVLLVAGAFRTFEPEIYARFVDVIGQPLSRNLDFRGWLPADLPRDSAVRVFLIGLIFLAGQVALVMWSLVAWGAFRELNGLSQWRSLGALMIVAVLAVPIVIVVVLVTNVIS